MSKLNDADLEKMWAEFGDTPINDMDEILEDFYQWEAGTYRFDVWKWFDENYSKGVYELAYPAE